MIHPNTMREMAEGYHRALPEDIRQYLKGRGLLDTVIDEKLLGWSGNRITIPVFDRFGNVVAFRFGKAPGDVSDSPKMLSGQGDRPELYGAEVLTGKVHHVVICEGEYDRLVLASHGIPAVTSTAGAHSFLADWAPLFEGVTRIFVCFDRDAAGELGAAVVKSVLPRAVVVKLPEAVGQGGDITDFFVRLGNTRPDFDLLLATAAERAEREGDVEPAALLPFDKPPPVSVRRDPRAARARERVSLHLLAGRYASLTVVGARLVGRCPFHDDSTPSFTIYPSGTYFCFGCQAHGDVITFVMHKESKTYSEALDYLERLDLTDDH